MQATPRNGASIDRVYLHLNEGPQTTLNAAQNLAHYLTTIDAGYHVVVDNGSNVRCAGDDQVVWAEGGDNTHALSVCMIGYSASTDWNSPYSQAMVERAAQQVAAWCRAYNIPVTHVPAGAPGQAPAARGIAEHADDHAPASQGHTDPGSNFPIDLFVMRVQTILTPAVDWHGIAALQHWQAVVTASPLEFQQTRHEVIILKQLLTKRGYHVEPGEFYGSEVSRAVAQFKAKAKLTNRIGEVVAADCAHALIADPL